MGNREFSIIVGQVVSAVVLSSFYAHGLCDRRALPIQFRKIKNIVDIGLGFETRVAILLRGECARCSPQQSCAYRRELHFAGIGCRNKKETKWQGGRSLTDSDRPCCSPFLVRWLAGWLVILKVRDTTSVFLYQLYTTVDS